MVCSPHRYIVSGIAAGGINYSSETLGVPYKRSVYSNRYAEPAYETKKQNAFDYVQQQNAPEKIENTRTPYTYIRSPAFEELPLEPEPFERPTITYTPLSRFSPVQHIPRTAEIPMTNQNLRQTKQKLAQLIMNELETLGPREEHAHEHGENTHVH